MKRFRRLLTALLAVLMLLGAGSALADQPVIVSNLPTDVWDGAPQTIFDIVHRGTNYNWRVIRLVENLPVLDDYDNPVLFGNDVNADTSVIWDYWYLGDYYDDGRGHDHRLEVTADNRIQYFNFAVDYISDDFNECDWIVYPTYYSYNTVCSFGPQFRELSPELTSKWYMFTPLDLSKDGKQTFDLIGGSVYRIGKVDVLVEGDSVTVTYKDRNRHVWDYGQFLTFFADYDAVTTVNPDEIERKFEFGRTYSIENDFGGDTEQLMFICNIVTFTDSNPGLDRFWINLPENKDLRSQMLEMIGK